MKRYDKDHLSNISFPIGGIGAGSIGLAGNGALIDWEIKNRPNRMSINPFSGFAIKTEDEEKVLDMRVLQGDVDRYFMGGMFLHDYGYGPPNISMAGLKHFSDTTFEGCYPMAKVNFDDPDFAGHVTLSAFNPFIPSNAYDSSLPCGIYRYTIENTSDRTLSYTVGCHISNPFDTASVNRYEKNGDISMMKLTALTDKNDPKYGEFVVSTDAEDVAYQEYWYRGTWFDGLTMFINDFGSFGPVKNRHYDKPQSDGKDNTLLTAKVTLAPGEKKTIPFIFSWYVPNVVKYWGDQTEIKQWKNYYATVFDSASAVASYVWENLERLSADTERFTKALSDSTLPEPVLDAIQGNLAIIKSTTCLRLEDGSFYGWEGSNQTVGSCEGNCQHVWGYVYALAYLFPKLEKSVREYELHCNLEENGLMHFRTMLPLGESKMDFRSCVDGQMGTVMRIYREWMLSGDTAWLEKNWALIKKCIAYAWEPTNTDLWDPDKTGVITGRQHHTLDVELFGANAWLTGFYLGGLEAGIEMAKAMGDTAAANEYAEVLSRGKAAVDALFDEKLGYYVQQVDVTDRSVLDRFPGAEEYYWDTENEQLKYQMENGCGIDQVLADYHTGLNGLAPVFDQKHRKAALESIYRNNFVSMREHHNPCRVFACNGEKGVVMFKFPAGVQKPQIPIPYAEECMTGFEYAVACQMLQVGMEDEAVKIYAAIRERYDGAKRNPWVEIECGASYSRAMASYSYLPIYSGFVCDLPHKTVGFKPMGEGSYFWSLDGAWGVVEYTDRQMEIKVLYGELSLEQIVHPYETVSAVTCGKEAVDYTVKGDMLKGAFNLCAGDAVTVFA